MFDLFRQMTAVFFYGTLMSEAVLGRVLCGPRAPAVSRQEKLNTLHRQPATLKLYRRWALKNREYPGITPCNDITGQVSGVLCQGLNAKDTALLEAYEGNEYACRSVVVKTVANEEVACLAYIWIAGDEHLLNDDWDLQDFLAKTRDKWLADENEFREADHLQ